MENLSRREFLSLTAAGALTAFTSAGGCRSNFAGRPSTAKQPNILFLLTDNQHWRMMGCAGNPIIHTPNMDKLAASGVRFTNAFVTTPICAASRASVLTGLYERTHQFTFKTPPLRTEFTDISYPAMLRSAGYRTGLIGKFGIETSGRLLVENKKQTLAKMFDVFDNFEHRGPDAYFVRQPDGSMKHLTDVTGEKAIEFLRTCNPDKPFCLSVSFNAPHAQDNDPRQYFWPKALDHLYEDATIPIPETAEPAFFKSQPEFIRKSLGRERWGWRFDTPEKYQRMMKGIYRMVSGVDAVIGRLMDELKRLKIDDNTVVLFCSDNGMFFSHRGLSDCWLMYEDSIRVPMIIFDPGAKRKARRTTVDDMVLNIDIAPTILDLAGVEAPRQMQGCSLVPFVNGQSPRWRTDFFCEHLFKHRKIPRSEGVRTKRYKYIRYFERQPIYEELYDLKNDPMETSNLADKPQYSDILILLRKQCDNWIRKAK